MDQIGQQSYGDYLAGSDPSQNGPPNDQQAPPPRSQQSPANPASPPKGDTTASPFAAPTSWAAWNQPTNRTPPAPAPQAPAPHSQASPAGGSSPLLDGLQQNPAPQAQFTPPTSLGPPRGSNVGEQYQNYFNQLGQQNLQANQAQNNIMLQTMQQLANMSNYTNPYSGYQQTARVTY